MILTVEQARGSIATGLSDDALRLLLDAAEEQIDSVLGRLDANVNKPVVNTYRPGPGPMLMLASRATDIVEVLEESTLLDASDYALRPSGLILDRLPAGSVPASFWRGPVRVTYTPYPDVDRRAVAQLELVRLEIAYNPGLSSQSIGPWSESYNASKPYPDAKAEILESIAAPFVGVW